MAVFCLFQGNSVRPSSLKSFVNFVLRNYDIIFMPIGRYLGFFPLSVPSIKLRQIFPLYYYSLLVCGPSRKKMFDNMDTYMIQDIVAQKRDLRTTKDYLKHA